MFSPAHLVVGSEVNVGQSSRQSTNVPQVLLNLASESIETSHLIGGDFGGQGGKVDN